MLDIFSVSVAVVFIALLIAATIMTIVHDDNPGHVYDDDMPQHDEELERLLRDGW
jgi:hypothetical protein